MSDRWTAANISECRECANHTDDQCAPGPCMDCRRESIDGHSTHFMPIDWRARALAAEAEVRRLQIEILATGPHPGHRPGYGTDCPMCRAMAAVQDERPTLLPDEPPPRGGIGDVILNLVATLDAGRLAGLHPLPSVVASARDACAYLRLDFRAALLERRDKGIATYGTPLRAGNGRDAWRDCCAELLDAVIYGWQAHMEAEGPPEGRG